MKKVIFALVAVVALAACSQEDVIVADKGAAIGFDTFVENSTRSVYDPSYTNDNMFDDFAVFGYVEGAVLFDGVQVAKTITNGDLESAWKYAGTQYWITGAMYNFNAVAPKTDGNWTVVKKDADNNVVTDATQTTISFTNDGTTDLLYAKTPVIEGKAENNPMVAFTFRHALSKVKLSFANQYNATNAKIMVKNIEITDPYKTAKAVLTTAANWSDQATAANFKLNFGDATDNAATANTAAAFGFGTTLESYKELLMIPGAGATTQTINDVVSNVYTITFVVELYQGESTTPIKTYNHTIYTTFAPQAGMRYNLKAVITPENIDPNHQQEPIEFTVTEIIDWDEDHDGKENTEAGDADDTQVDTPLN